MEIAIGLTGLAKYVAADDAGKRTVLQEYKFPNGRQRDYYRDATNATIRLHRGTASAVILTEAADLDARALVATSDQTRNTLRHNARAIRELVAMVGGDVAPFLRVERGLYLWSGDVRVKAAPTMVVKCRRRELFVRMHFGLEPLSETAIKVITQSMFEAASAAGRRLASNAAVIYDVHRGVVHRGARKSSRIARVVEAALANIALLWPAIEPPRRRVRA